jgi:hypothetical protein
MIYREKRHFWKAALAIAVLSLSLLRALEAHGQSSRVVEGTVVAIDSGDLVVDIGSANGARVGQVIELWRPMRLRHPVSGKMLTDRFKIGRVRLVEVQKVLSIARIDADSEALKNSFSRAPATGDQVVLPALEPVPSATTAAAAPTLKSAAATGGAATVIVTSDPAERELSDLFTSLEGTDPLTRAHAYAKFIKTHPQSRYVRVLDEEVAAINLSSREKKTAQERDKENPYQISFVDIARLRPGTPQRFAIELDTRFVGAVVHVRQAGASSYRSIAMESVGPRYWAATLPGDAINEPSMEYFVEGVPKIGTPIAVIGSADTPKDAPVDPHPVTGKQSGTLAQLSLSSELASFNLKKANDYVFQTEGAFGWRLQDTGIRAVRSGFGVLRGKGGTLVDLDQLDRSPRDVGLTYGWIETEIATSHSFSLIGRPIIGLREGGVTGGLQGFFRIGNDLATNLSIGGEVLGTVGLRGIVQLEWRTIPRVPILLRSEVTNQPAGIGGDIGARAIGQVGYEVMKDLAVAVRGSYQGRTIDHAGPGGGMGVSYQW